MPLSLLYGYLFFRFPIHVLLSVPGIPVFFACFYPHKEFTNTHREFDFFPLQALFMTNFSLVVLDLCFAVFSPFCSVALLFAPLCFREIFESRHVKLSCRCAPLTCFCAYFFPFLPQPFYIIITIIINIIIMMIITICIIIIILINEVLGYHPVSVMFWKQLFWRSVFFPSSGKSALDRNSTAPGDVSLHVSGMPPSTTEQDILDFFRTFRARVLRVSYRPQQGFAFIHFIRASLQSYNCTVLMYSFARQHCIQQCI